MKYNKIIFTGIVVLGVCLLLLNSVVAAGGGSGGGSGPFFYGLKCDDTGKLTFFQKPEVKPVTIIQKKNGKVFFDVKGKWEGTTFTSDEAIFREEGEYEVIDLKNGNKTVTCPGFRFSCAIVNVDVQKCVREGERWEVYFVADNVKVEDLKFEFQRKGSGKGLLSYSKRARSLELKDLKWRTLTPKGRYVFEVDYKGDIGVVQVAHPDCVGQEYVYSKAKCVEETEVVAEKEKKGKELKCGGYLSIEDRVACRLQLREEQRDEYENFYPEECMAMKDKEKCLNVYEAVQPCWMKAKGEQRISCVKNAVNVGEIAGEKAKCAGLKEEMREDCLLLLREKVYAVVKFRLYNLEEEAEELLEKEYLSFADVRDFVVKMELKKSAFNAAQNKNARVKVLLDAREDWRELMGKVKQ